MNRRIQTIPRTQNTIPTIRADKILVGDNPLKYQQKTLQVIGKIIRRAALDPRIRGHAARLAARAAPKDYFGQVSEIFNDFVKNWRYVKDPIGTELLHGSPSAIYQYVIGQNGGLGEGKGAGDCDDATIALGSLLTSIGMPVRLAITAPPNAAPGKLMAHIFAQTLVPGLGWVSVDPVPYPQHGLGYTPPHSRMAVYDLGARLLGKTGNFAGEKEIKPMSPYQQYQESQVYQVPQGYQGYHDDNFVDLGFGSLGLSEDNDPEEILDWRTSGPVHGFGRYVEDYGLLGGGSMMAEVQTYRTPDGGTVAMAPMIELAPFDHSYVATHGIGYDGMLGLGEDGDVYEYDGLGGFFKRLIKRGRKALKKVGKRVKKLLKKTKFGRYLVRFGEKLYKVAKKFVKPLIKYVGKYAAKLAPVAALIPGVGPAVAGAMFTAGKVANLMQKYGVKTVGKKGKARILAYKSKKAKRRFKEALAKAAKKQSRRMKSKRRSPRLRSRNKRRVVRRRSLV